MHRKTYDDLIYDSLSVCVSRLSRFRFYHFMLKCELSCCFYCVLSSNDYNKNYQKWQTKHLDVRRRKKSNTFIYRYASMESHPHIENRIL